MYSIHYAKHNAIKRVIYVIIDTCYEGNYILYCKISTVFYFTVLYFFFFIKSCNIIDQNYIKWFFLYTL